MDAQKAPRAVLYARTSAADFGKPAEETYLPMLRAHAHRVGWEVVETVVDRTHRPTDPRPGVHTLNTIVAAGAADVVAVVSLAQPFRSAHDLAMAARRWLDRGVVIVAINEGLDGTTPEGRQILRGLAGPVAAFLDRRQSEAITCGAILTRAKRGGVPIGPPARAINRLEVAALYHCADKWRPMAEIAREIGISKGTLRRVLSELDTEGVLDHCRRRQKAPPPGVVGRRPERMRYDAAALRALHERGYGIRRMLVAGMATGALPKSATRWKLARCLREIGLDLSVRRPVGPSFVRHPETSGLESALPKAAEGGGA